MRVELLDSDVDALEPLTADNVPEGARQRQRRQDHPLWSQSPHGGGRDLHGPRYRALVLLATFASLRFGELLGLRRRDVDLDGPQLWVRKATGEMNSGEQVDGNPESDAGKRPIAWPKAIVPILREHLARYAQPGGDGRLFVGPKGGVPRRSNFNRIWEKTIKAAGANEDRHLHDLRHTGGTLAAGTPGANVRDLMARLGHSSPRAALIYLHTNNKRDRLMDGPTEPRRNDVDR